MRLPVSPPPTVSGNLPYFLKAYYFLDKFDILKMIETIYIARHGMNKHYPSIATSNISIKAIG